MDDYFNKLFRRNLLLDLAADTKFKFLSFILYLLALFVPQT